MYSEQSYQNIIRSGNMVPANVEAPADIDPLFKEMTGALADVKEVTPVFDIVMPATVVAATKTAFKD